MRKLSNLALDTVNLLSEAFNTFLKERDVDPLIRKAQEVEKMEEKVDDFRANEIFPNITKWADKNHKCGTVLLILEIEENIEEVVDTTEDVTDILREIGISSV
ncbi:hypothetical protein AKJ51_05050 [candidate division MSBL1 archaeon SCGC-AAA382A20]|uniref:DUF47 domain-containing protein n=1 Tax=candidate division MSBL1 archaeon SCGC-AAA382A20 TaxID=1698280 RepID=A0A133VG83_9EURY|nr:hypothetical protein AKJ51_05050 [candidate division MSBL1 archaeon SCGC-AAA382A20]